jgi:heterotetrameric sarcosine oxidase beta subunit
VRYSGFRVIAEALTGHKGWKPVWRDPTPQAEYDYIIIGGGGHGLATAYYLAKEFGQARIAVLEKGYLGGGNVGRNTTIIRSNYLLDGNEPFYEFSLKLWEGLEQDFNYNAMVSQRGIINLIHTDAQRDAFTRRGNGMIMHGAGARMLSRDEVRQMYPWLNFDNARFPIKGALMQPRGGTVRHDAVAWGYARGADMRGVDLIQNCEVTGMRIENGRIRGVETSRGFIGAKKVGVAVAGSSSKVMAHAGMRLPIESHVLQAFVSEGLKPVIDGVMTFGAGHFYVSQSDKGGLVFGGDHRRLQLLRPTRQPAGDRGCGRGRHGADARHRSGAPVADLGRDHGHVDGRLADHRQDRGRRALFQRRLVLWRLQGHARKRLVLRASSGEGRTAQDRHGLSLRPLPQGADDRRKGPGRPAEPALKGQYE